MEKLPVLVVGGGGAGLLAAWRVADLGVPVRILERNGRPGVKIRISGLGKCNLTHEGPPEELLGAFLPGEARFLKSAFFRFTNRDIVKLLAKEGVPAAPRADGRVFPLSERAADVVHAMERLLEARHAAVECGVRVADVARDLHGVAGVVTGAGVIPSRHIVLATGGVSYPRTGSTGDGIRWAGEMGHA
ncbi:MAG: NAD(P)/FAD-dependent oxidoreductase, partial [Bacteroidota bacterium]